MCIDNSIALAVNNVLKNPILNEGSFTRYFKQNKIYISRYVDL